MHVAEVRLVGVAPPIANAVFGHERTVPVGEGVDRRRAHAAGGAGTGHEHGVPLRRGQEGGKRRTVKRGRPLSHELNVRIAPDALIDLRSPANPA